MIATTILGQPVDPGFLLCVAAFWVGLLSAFVGVVWFAGAYLAERDRRHEERRRPPAPLVPLDLERAARRRRRHSGDHAA